MEQFAPSLVGRLVGASLSLALLAGLVVLGQDAARPVQAQQPGPTVGPPVAPTVFDGDVKTLPTVTPRLPGEPVPEIPRGIDVHPTPTPTATPTTAPASGEGGRPADEPAAPAVPAAPADGTADSPAASAGQGGCGQ
jgi:hypothetical protein